MVSREMFVPGKGLHGRCERAGRGIHTAQGGAASRTARLRPSRRRNLRSAGRDRPRCPSAGCRQWPRGRHLHAGAGAGIGSWLAATDGRELGGMGHGPRQAVQNPVREARGASRKSAADEGCGGSDRRRDAWRPTHSTFQAALADTASVDERALEPSVLAKRGRSSSSPEEEQARPAETTVPGSSESSASAPGG